MGVNQDDVLRVTAEMSIGNNSVQNVMHFRSTNAPIIGDSEALGDLADIMDALYTEVNTFVTDGQTYDEVRVQNVTQDILLGAALWPVLNAGAATGDRIADQVAALITLPSTTPKVRGGVYLGIFGESGIGTNSDLVGGLAADVATFAAQLLLEQVFGVNSYRYVIYNRILETFVLPTAAIVHSAWRTQRRRRIGVGS